MSINSVNVTTQPPEYGSELQEPGSPCRASIAHLLKLDGASHLHVDLRQQLEEATENLFHTHGPELTKLELERQINLVDRWYERLLTEPPDDGARGVARPDWFDRARDPVSGLLRRLAK
jgi:hypothetical protein